MSELLALTLTAVELGEALEELGATDGVDVPVLVELCGIRRRAYVVDVHIEDGQAVLECRLEAWVET